jgi:hypothetical protein
MAKHIIFLVHGMGDTQPGWSRAIQAQIKRLYSGYLRLNLLVPFDNNFTFHELWYNDKFEERRQAWKQNAQGVLNALKSKGLQASAVTQLAKYGEQPSADNFLGTHVLDVVLYRFIPQIASQIRSSLNEQILQRLTQEPEDEVVHWSVIAHSLGTSVIHDTLHAMYSAGLPASVTRPRTLAMLANVSRVLQNDFKVYTSLVNPSLDAAKGLCDYYLNARHEWDLIPVPKMFKPVDDWPDLPSRREHRYQNLVINAIADKNVHDLAHYLQNPKVHIPLFRTLTWNDVIEVTEEEAAIAAYEASTPLSQFEDLIKDIKKVWISEEANCKQIIKGFGDFQALIKNIDL